MGQITRLLKRDLVGGNGNEDVYPITATNAVIQPGSNKTLEDILTELNRVDSVRSIRNVELINSGMTLRFIFTDNDIKDIDLPKGVKAITIQKEGDIDIMTITNMDGSTTVYNIENTKMVYDVLAADNSVTVTKTVNAEEKTTTFFVTANLPQVNDGVVTFKQGNTVLGTFSANQSANVEVEIPTVAGETGAQGPQGEKGDKGDKGDTGATGQNGTDGKSAYQSWLDLGNQGTEADFILSLKGETGAAGTNGTNGIDGTDGTNGIDGKSAYQIAVDNGFVGTEAEWLLSLKGQDGQDGTNGTNGTNGVDGQDGQDGITPSIDPTTKHWMIGSTDTGVVAEGKDGQNGKDAEESGLDATFYDISVSSWRELIRAINFSLGYSCESENDDDTFVQDTWKTTNAIHTAGDPIVKRGCRIHLQGDITIGSNVVLDLSYCQIEGYNNAIIFPSSASEGKKLIITGNSAIFKNCRFYARNCSKTTEASTNNPVIYFAPALVSGGMNVIFEDCYFRDFWDASSTDNKRCSIASGPCHKSGQFHGKNVIGMNPTVNYRFIRCRTANDPSYYSARKSTNAWNNYMHICRDNSFLSAVDSLVNNSYKIVASEAASTINSDYTINAYAHTGLVLEQQNTFDTYNIHAFRFDKSEQSSNKVTHDGSIYTIYNSSNDMQGVVTDVLKDASNYTKTT